MNIAENNELVNGDTIFHGIANNLSPIIAAFISSIIVGLGALIAWKTYKNTRESTPPELLKLDKWTDSTKKIIELEEKSSNRLLSLETMNELKESIDIYTQRALWESSLIKSGAPKGIQRRLSNKYPSENKGKSADEIIPGKLIYILCSIIVRLVWILGSCILLILFAVFVLEFFLKLTNQSISIDHNQNTQYRDFFYSILGDPKEIFSTIRLSILIFLIRIIPHVFIYIFMRSYILNQIYYASSRNLSPSYKDEKAVLSTHLNRFTLWERLSVGLIDVMRINSFPVISSKRAKRFIVLFLSYFTQFLIIALMVIIYGGSQENSNLRLLYSILLGIMLIAMFVSILFDIILFIWPDVGFLTYEELHIFGLDLTVSPKNYAYNVSGVDLVVHISNTQDPNDDIYISCPIKYSAIKKISSGREAELIKTQDDIKYFFKFKFNHENKKVIISASLSIIAPHPERYIPAPRRTPWSTRIIVCETNRRTLS
jgi:membrane protein